MWSALQRLTGARRSTNPDLLMDPQGQLTEPEAIAEALAQKYFVQPAPYRQASYKTNCNADRQQWLTSLPPLETEFDPFAVSEILEVYIHKNG